MLYRRQQRAALAVVLILAALAATAAPHRERDLRNQTDSTGEYSISLCSRPSPGPAGLPGHAFIAYSHLPPGGSPRKFLALGFTTAAGPIEGLLSFSSRLATPQGFLGEEMFTHVKENCLVLLVNQADFERAYALATPYGAIPRLQDLRYMARYSLGTNDCMTFAISTAKLFEGKGVKVPARGPLETPQAYVRRLIDAN